MDNIDNQIDKLRLQIAELEKQKEDGEQILQGYSAAKKRSDRLEHYLPDEGEFERMKDYNDDYSDMTHIQFIAHNMKCYSELSRENQVWLHGLFQRMFIDDIRAMDMEHCSIMTVNYVCFDKNGAICIGTPR